MLAPPLLPVGLCVALVVVSTTLTRSAHSDKSPRSTRQLVSDLDQRTPDRVTVTRVR